MGAGQSNNTTPEATVKTSYYELIGVTRQATDDEIKKAYRKKALELHPDRNFGNEQEATRIFADIQAAYEVLSDPQERAWYDSHESAILRGDDGAGGEEHSYENVRVTSADDLARVVRKFNSHVEFTDAPSGFFGFLREQFDHLIKEEEAAAAWEDVDVKDYPTFGHKDDTHDDVVKSFYSAWTNFSTVKTFAWKDKYRLSEAPDRRIRRLMEKENASFRQEAIREFNEAVRSFVLFVRKRDPRYKPSSQSEAERQAMLRDAAAAQAARARAANQAKLEGEIPAWATYREADELEESEEEEIEEEIFECVACNKTFKSEKQFEAHERSKKHQKAIYALQKKMRKENAHLELDEDAQYGHDDGIDDDHDNNDRNEINETIRGEEEQGDELDEYDVINVDEIDMPEMAENKTVPQHNVEHDSKDDEVDASSDEQQALSADDELVDSMAESTIAEKEIDDEDKPTPSRKIGKAAQKRAKKAAAGAASEANANGNNHKCAGCNATFPSRTRLFQHIKDHGHAALKPASGQSAKGKKGKVKR